MLQSTINAVCVHVMVLCKTKHISLCLYLYYKLILELYHVKIYLIILAAPFTVINCMLDDIIRTVLNTKGKKNVIRGQTI